MALGVMLAINCCASDVYFHAIADEITDGNDTIDSCKCCAALIVVVCLNVNVVADANAPPPISEISMHDVCVCDAVYVVDVCMYTDSDSDVRAKRARGIGSNACKCGGVSRYCVSL